MLSIKLLYCTEIFIFFNVEVSWTLKRICFKQQNFFVKRFAYANFRYGAVSNFDINTKLGKLANANLLKLEISTFGQLFCLFCQY